MPGHLRPYTMMFGEDSSGRKVSLLNEPPPKHPPYQHSTHDRATKFSLPSSTWTRHRKHPSESPADRCASTSSEETPSTPPLSRLNSISSVGTQTTPSPMTPEYPFEPLDQSKSNGHPYFSIYQRSNGSAYPTMPQAQDPSGQPYFPYLNQRMSDAQMEDPFPNLDQAPLHPVPPQPQYPTATDTPLSMPLTTALPPQITQPSSKPSPVINTTSSNPTNNSDQSSSTSSKAIKKKYPCPHAVRFSCGDTFTTSGHAARHGKKHTGEKNIHCPTCNKAFTRKDNMKQHERTHKGSRAEIDSPTSPTASTNKPTSAPARQRRTAPAPTNSHSPVVTVTDGATLEFDGDSSKLDLSGQLRLPDSMQDMRPSVNGRISSFSGRSEADGEGDSPGLDALAHVASEMAG